VHHMAFFWYKGTPCFVSQDQKVGSIKELFFGPENEEEVVTALARLSFDELVDIKALLKVQMTDLRKANNKVIAKAIFDKIMAKKASESSSKDVKDVKGVKDVKSKTGASSSKDEKSLAGVSSSKDKKDKKKKKVVTPTPSPSQSEYEESEEEGSEEEGSEEEEVDSTPPKRKPASKKPKSKAAPKTKGKKAVKESPTLISIATDDEKKDANADDIEGAPTE
jgi:hypothetical protein